MNVFSGVYERRELLYNLVVRNLKSRYKDSALGFLWSVLTPLFMALIYMVFLKILARGVPMEQVLIGVFAWQFTAQCINNGLGAVTENATLVKKVYFPRVILPLAVTISNLVNFLLTLLVQFALVAAILGSRGAFISPAAAGVLFVIPYHALCCFALALFLSCLNVFFRDIQHLVGVATTAWFFLTPAMYSLELVRDTAAAHGVPRLADFYMLNPMACIITAYRALVLPDVVFPWNAFSIIGLLLPVPLLAGAWLLFRKHERNFADAF